MPAHQELPLDCAGESAGEVERKRGGLLGVELVVIGGRAGEIRGKMEGAIREPSRECDAGAPVGPGPHPSARHRVVIVVVEVVDPRGPPCSCHGRGAHARAVGEIGEHPLPDVAVERIGFVHQRGEE